MACCMPFLLPEGGAVTMSYRRFIVLALIAAMPGMARAQFTTFIPPHTKGADSVKAAAVVQQRAVSDSIAKVQIADMKTWVDSAAGVLPTPNAASDSPIPSSAPSAASAATMP